jgi:hypothetical protein
MNSNLQFSKHQSLYKQKIRYLLMILALYIGLNIQVLHSQNSQTWSIPGTFSWTCPAGVTSVNVECWGGGGGGSYVDFTTGGGGGGGGAYATRVVSVVPGQSYTIIVGNGGIGYIGGFSPSIANSGGFSSFMGSEVIAGGGCHGGPDILYSVSAPGGGGGCSGTACPLSECSEGAEPGENGMDGYATVGYLGGGNGGKAGGSNGGLGGSGGIINGSDGTAPGGGGGGAGGLNDLSNAGRGASGQVIISWTDITDIKDEYQNQILSLKNYPNPFSETTQIHYYVPQSGIVSLEIYNINGQKVASLIANEKQSKGMKQIPFCKDNLQSGIYLCSITVATEIEKFKSSNYMIIY